MKKLLLAVLFFCCFFLAGCLDNGSGGIIEIENISDVVIKDIKIKYKSSKMEIKIGDLSPSKNMTHQVKIPLSEDSIFIEYLNAKGERKEIIAMPYYVKGSNEKSHVNLN